MDLVSAFPHLISQNAERTHFSGFLNIKGQSFYLDIHLKSSNNPQVVSLACEWKLKDILQEYEQLLSQRSLQCKSLIDFLHELKRIVELQLETGCHGHSAVTTLHVKLYDHLIEEIEQIGWERLTFVDQTFKELHLVAEDEKHRKHILKIHLTPEYPKQEPRCLTDLPKAFNFIWTAESKLSDLWNQFSHSLDQYQDLWDNFDEIDKNTWILEPEKCTRAGLYRRIALAGNASVQITVSADHPRMLPECRFLGADHVINPLKLKLNNNLHKWNASLSLLSNLKTILEVAFPSPSETNKQDFSMECGICYAYHLGDEIPDQVCDDPRCGQPFHHSCLYEWLRSLPSFRQSFNVAFGECPYCSTAITVKTLR